MNVRCVALVALLSVTTAHDWQTEPTTRAESGISCDPSSVNHSKIVVAAVGDSITVGFHCKKFHGGYVYKLSRFLERTHPGKYDVRDCGVCGTDAVRKDHGNIHHLSYWDTPQHKNSLALKPDVVIFMLGTNDADEWGPCTNSSLKCGNTSSFYEQDWKDLVAGYIALDSTPKVVPMIPPPYMNWTCPATCPPFDGTNKEIAKACVIDCILPKLVTNLTASIQLPPPIDLLTFFGGPDHTNKALMPGLHPSCDGYISIAQYLEKELFATGEVGKKTRP